MKCNNKTKCCNKKLILCLICGFVTLAAAITAIIVFRNQIADFCEELKTRVEEKKRQHKGEFADYADI